MAAAEHDGLRGIIGCPSSLQAMSDRQPRDRARSRVAAPPARALRRLQPNAPSRRSRGSALARAACDAGRTGAPDSTCRKPAHAPFCRRGAPGMPGRRKAIARKRRSPKRCRAGEPGGAPCRSLAFGQRGGAGSLMGPPHPRLSGTNSLAAGQLWVAGSTLAAGNRPAGLANVPDAWAQILGDGPSRLGGAYRW